MEGRFGHAHPVIGWPCQGVVEVQPDDRAAASLVEQRPETICQSLERERRGQEGRARRLWTGLEEPATERIERRIGDRMERTVNPTPLRIESFHQRLHV